MTDWTKIQIGQEVEFPKPAGKIKVTQIPHYNKYWDTWYVVGNKWIKTKSHYSSNSLIHNFKASEQDRPNS